MTKENVLYSIIGVLSGFIIGFIFAISVNQRDGAPRAAGANTGAGQQLPMNAVRDQQGPQTGTEEAARLAREEPNNFDAQMRAAGLTYSSGRYDDAIQFLLRANELQPGNYDVIVALGNTNFEARNFAVAERWYTAALERRPDDVDVRTDLGLTFFLRDPPDTDRAVAEFRRSLERDPRHEQTLHNLVIALARKKEFAEAERTLARLEQANPQSPSISKLRAEVQRARAEN